ncbi:MAG: hypothetical protein MZU97_20495 [Bacillus subtilis]|nr:hypothetical protein [Bacillus subtilis]
MAEVGDRVTGYEIAEYNMTRPLSFTNWLTTDPPTHDNEPDPIQERFRFRRRRTNPFVRRGVRRSIRELPCLSLLPRIHQLSTRVR